MQPDLKASDTSNVQSAHQAVSIPTWQNQAENFSSSTFDIYDGREISASPAEQNPYHTCMENIPNEDELLSWMQKYSRSVAEMLKTEKCTFGMWRRENAEAVKPCWPPFASEKERAMNGEKYRAESDQRIPQVGYRMLHTFAGFFGRVLTKSCAD